MAYTDVFNGDADGILSLHQLRLAHPRESRLVTGVKRDIGLLERVEAGEGDLVTVLDISLDKNREALERLLDAGAHVHYYDHHFAGEIPDAPHFKAEIDTESETCTGLIVNRDLEGAHLPWAVAAAFGDNMYAAAVAAAVPLNLGEADLGRLEELGTLINYNGYGVELDDLFFPPDELYRHIAPFVDPFDFVAEAPAFRTLREGFASDMARAEKTTPEIEEEGVALYILPDAPWARRVSGAFGNALARANPQRAHALLTELPDGAYRVSVRAPLADRRGADELCGAFPSGGGRRAAAGINHLPAAMFAAFADAFRGRYAG